MRVLIIAALLTLSGCSSLNPINWIKPNKIEIQQGNYVTQDAVNKLKVGMTKSQVKFVLGTPLLTDSFHANRWDYKYQDYQNGKKVKDTLLTVYFKNDLLEKVEGQAQPAETTTPPLPAPTQNGK